LIDKERKLTSRPDSLNFRQIGSLCLSKLHRPPHEDWITLQH